MVDILDIINGLSDLSSADPSILAFIASRDISMSEINATIVGMGIESDYLKSCKTVVVGYTNPQVQILRSDCIYGGIRDLSGFIDVDFIIKDLYAYIKSTVLDLKDLNSLLKGFSKDSYDITAIVEGWFRNTQRNLNVYIKNGYTSTADFSAYVKTFLTESASFFSIIKGWKRSEVVVLPNIIKGYSTSYRELLNYTKATTQQFSDLCQDIFKIWQVGQAPLQFNLDGWQTFDIKKYIVAISYVDFPVSIRATYLYNLMATLTAVTPVNLSSSLYGWAASDLNLSIAYARSPLDMFVSINPVQSVDLPVSLKSFLVLEAYKNLTVKVQSHYTSNLNIFIDSVAALNLAVTICAGGASKDLGVLIYPKIVYVRTLLSISYLECVNLAATVNPLCFSSTYSNLGIQLYSMHNKNLTASVFGTDGSNICDLSVFINDFSYYEENIFKLHVFKDPYMYTSITLKLDDFKTYDEVNNLKLVAHCKKYNETQLGASITGKHFEVDLSAIVMAYSPRSYESDTVKEKFITLKLNHSSVEEWHRYVELTFSSYVRSYYYFSGDQKAYREFIDDQWVVQVKGYSLVDLPDGIDRTKINRKYIFNLKRYTSIDAAIKDMTARVTELKNTDLGCEVVVEPKKEANLSILIASRSVYKSNRLLPVIINPV